MCIPQTASTPNLNSKTTTFPPNSPEADGPSPISQYPLNSSTTSDESIDIMGDIENETAIHHVPPSPQQTITHSPSPTSNKTKLINKILTPLNPNLDPLSPVERKAMRKVLRSRYKTNPANLKFINKNVKKTTNNNSSKYD